MKIARKILAGAFVACGMIFCVPTMVLLVICIGLVYLWDTCLEELGL